MLPSASCLPPHMKRCWSDFGIPSVVLNHLLYVADGVGWHDLERDGLAILAGDLDGDGRGGLHALLSI